MVQERTKQDPTARRSSRAQRRMERADARAAAAPVREEIFEVGDEGMSVSEVSQRLAVSPAEVVKSLFMQGIMVQVNQVRSTFLLPLCATVIDSPANLRPLPHSAPVSLLGHRTLLGQARRGNNL